MGSIQFKTGMSLFIVRRLAWKLTLWGWVLVLSFCGSIFALFLISVNPFLSLNRPIVADILVVEGWMPDYALLKAAEEFRSGKYKLLIATGGPISQGSFLTEYKSNAELAYATLARMGVDKVRLKYVPAPPVLRDRTRISAVALHNWLASEGLGSARINLVSLGPHSRRSHQIFKRALQGHEVGVICVQPDDYDPFSWWSSSSGVQTVIPEAIAFLYASVRN